MASSQEIELRNSERQAFTTCPQKWDWGYNDRLKARTPTPALRFGTLIHGALEEFYKPGVKRGPKPAATFQRLYAEELKTQTKIGFRDEDGKWHEAGHMGTVLMEEYYDKYGKDDRWRILASEIPFRVPVVDPLTGIKFTYVGVMDLLALDRESGKRRDIWIWDHKTTRDDPTKKADILVLDDQTGSYWSHGVDYMVEQAILDAKANLTGMLYNFIRKGKPDERPKNELGQALNQNGTVSQKQPTPLFHREPVRRYEEERNSAKNRILAQARVMHYMRTGKLEIYKVPGTLHNPHCKWCEYRDMCELHEQGSNWQEMLVIYDKWNPYAQHEIEDGEKL